MGVVTLRGHIIVPDDVLEIVRAAMPEHIRLTRAEAGCLIFNITVRAGAPNIFDVHEEFENQAAFDAHQARTRKSEWANCSRTVERHYKITDK